MSSFLDTLHISLFSLFACTGGFLIVQTGFFSSSSFVIWVEEPFLFKGHRFSQM